ncbi:MAG: hypothetical protein LAN70_00895 [Acidobacteriia bacterium]|nr:hypothetical protein [Terriglobia bacterium]
MAEGTTEHKTEKIKMWTAIFALFLAVISAFTAVAALIDRSKAQATIRDLQAQLQTIGGKYEWQWAGDRWIGGLTITNDESGRLRAKVDVKQRCRDTWVEFMKGEGPVYQQDGGLRLEISSQVTNHDYGCNVTHTASPTVSGFLQPTIAFAGPVKWKENGQEGPGDMVLVRYTSSNKIY